MTKNQNKLINKIILLIVLLFVFSSLIFSGVGGKAHAAVAFDYSSVMEDLQSDLNFNAENYPIIENDNSLQVIQIAESVNGELFVYVYQPAARKDIKASSINIAREMDNSAGLGFKNYNLVCLSFNDVFFKYIVLNFELREDVVRYYNISNILRPFNSDYDEPPSDGQVISEVPYKVAQFWTACTLNGEVTYSMSISETIEIEQKYVGYCAYDDGLELGWGRAEGVTKAYFVAFSTDRPMDNLISADLTFCCLRAHCKICLNDKHKDHSLLYDFHDPEYIDFGTGVWNDEPLTITDKQYFGNQGGGNVRPATKFLKKRIRKTSEFIADENNKNYELQNATNDKLSGTEWVLNFYEAQDKYKVDNVWLSFVPGISSIKGVSDGECELNNVYDVSILRLEFETDGEIYNLGVVDNKQYGEPTNPPDNPPVESDESFFPSFGNCSSITWKDILIVFAVAIFAVVLIISIFKWGFKAVVHGIGVCFLWLFKGLWLGIKYLFICLWWVICLPFKGIKAMINKIRGD